MQEKEIRKNIKHQIYRSTNLDESVSKIKLSKAAEIETITPEMINSIDVSAKEAFRILLIIINEDKQSSIIPIYKKEDTRECENYRNITLTSIPGKILATIIEERIK